MKKNKLILLFFLSMIVWSCSKNNNLKILNGQYTGSYYYFNSSNMTKSERSANPVTLLLDQGNTYTSSGNIDRKPAGGSGDFIILKNNMVEFNDKNPWTAEFDWGLILNGRFNYEIKGDSLILTRYMEPCPQCSRSPSLYQYRLKRTG